MPLGTSCCCPAGCWLHGVARHRTVSAQNYRSKNCLPSCIIGSSHPLQRGEALDIHTKASLCVGVILRSHMAKLLVKQVVDQLQATSAALRRILFLVMGVYLQSAPLDEHVCQFMDKKRSEGKPYRVYMMDFSNKFLRIYYTSVTDRFKCTGANLIPHRTPLAGAVLILKCTAVQISAPFSFAHFLESFT